MEIPAANASGIEILNASNWSTWKEDIRVLLMDKGIWSFIEKTEPPIDTENSTRKDLQSYNVRRDRAYSTIYLTIEPTYRSLISDVKDGAEAFQILKNYFEPQSRARAIHLLDEFFDHRFMPDDDIAMFANRIKETVKKLKDCGHPVEEFYQTYQLIRYLPSEFQNIVQNIYRYPDKDFKFNVVLNELILEQSRIKQVKCDLDKVENDVFAHSSSFNFKKLSLNKNVYDCNKSAKIKSKSIIGPCFICKSPNHLMKDCKYRDTVSSTKSNSRKIDKQRKTRNSNAEVYVNQVKKSNKLEWLIDTAASNHFCNNLNLFSNYRPVNNMSMSLAANNSETPISGIGTVMFYVRDNGKKKKVVLNDVMYSPNLRRNLISGAHLERSGLTFKGCNGKIWVYNEKGQKLFYARRINNLYFVRPRYYKSQTENPETHETSNFATELSEDLKHWHNRFCHINTEYILNTCRNNSVKGLPIFKTDKFECTPCVLAKTKRKSFKPICKIRSSKPLELLHMDVCGPMPVSSINGGRYFLTITDDYSRRVTVYIMKQKSEVFECFTRYQKRVERFLNSKIINVRTDNGMEFCHDKFNNFLESQGIHPERTNPYTPEQNGVSERLNLTILDGVKAMLNDSGLEQKFWSEAVLCFAYVWNRICHKNCVKTPFELFCGKKPSVNHLRTFGSTVYVGIPKQLRKKLDMRAKVGIMVGYAMRTRGYRVFIKSENRVIETANVKFDENLKVVEAVLDPKNKKQYVIFDNTKDQDSDSDDENLPLNLTPCEDIAWIRVAVPRKDGSRTDIYYKIEGTNMRLRSPNDVVKYCKSNNINYNGDLFDFSGKNTFSGKISELNSESDIEASNIEIEIPKNYRDCLKVNERTSWLKAMEDEIQMMKSRDVWELVPPQKDKKIIGSRWVYTVKHDENNQIARYKARLVARGFSQFKGESYEEVFSPVVNFSVIRLIFATLLCIFKWSHCQIDIKSAYLYAKLNEVVFMSQPQGFVDKSKPDYVCKLKKAIYGLHQSSRQWFFELDNVLVSLNFKRLQWCNCVYVYNNVVVLLIYVDDIVLFGKTEKDIKSVLKLLEGKFDFKVLGKTKKLLGVEFTEEDGKLYIHQNTYINKVCNLYKRFNFPLSTLPISKGTVFSKLDCPSTDSEYKDMQKLPYRNILGCISYVANRTRPDLSYAVNILSQFQENPGLKHWNALLKLLGYLQYTNDYKLNLSNISNLNINCYCDSDYASNRDDRVSIGGLILLVDSVPVIWRTFKQKCVSLSSMESEFIAITEASKEVMWIKRILEELNELGIENFKVNESLILSDNQAAINYSYSPVENNRTKHIDVRFHFVRNLIYKSFFKIKYVNTKKNFSDIFTKPPSKEGLYKFCIKFFKGLKFE